MDTNYINEIWKPAGLHIIINDSRNFENVESLDSYGKLRNIRIYRVDDNYLSKVVEIKRMSEGKRKYHILFVNNKYYPPFSSFNFPNNPFFDNWYKSQKEKWEQMADKNYNTMADMYIENCQKLLNFLSTEAFVTLAQETIEIDNDGHYYSFRNRVKFMDQLEAC
jgi:hypothetical protein